MSEPAKPPTGDHEAIATLLTRLEERMGRLETDAAGGKDVSEILKEIADLRAQLAGLSHLLSEIEGSRGSKTSGD